MSDDERPFGKREGLEKRLAMWANQLSKDKQFPWIGLGIIDDLKAASRELGAEPFDKLYPSVIPKPAPAVEEEDEFADFHATKAREMEASEYDL